MAAGPQANSFAAPHRGGEPVSIQAVIFDLDDTVWRRTAPPDWNVITALQATELMPHCLRLGFDHLDLYAVVGRFWASFDAAYPEPEGNPDAPMEELRWAQGPAAIRNTLAEYGVDCADGDANCLWETLHTVPQRAFNYHLYPDAVSTVQALNAAGYRLAVATARPLSAAVVARNLSEQGMPDVFAAIVTSGAVGYRKPHPLVFDLAARQLGVQPENAVVVGDSYDEDIVPAAGLGMIPVLKLNEREPDSDWVLARYQIASLAALLQLDIFHGRR